MAVFEIETPDGRKFRVEGETREGALAALQEHLGVGARAPVEEKVGQVGGLSAMATQGALASFGDEYLAGLSAVFGVQPDGAGGANWFQYDKPIRERYSTALDQIRTEMDDYRSENPGRAATAQIAGAVTGGVAAGAGLNAGKIALTGRGFQAAPTAIGRAGQMAAGGAVGGAVEGFGSGEGVGDRLQRAAVGTVAGAVFAPVVGFGASKIANVAERIGGRALRSVFTNRRSFDPQTGRLTQTGRKRLENLGYNPDELSVEMQRAFGVAADRATAAGGDIPNPTTVGRLAAAERFNVPLTRGQATGDVAQIATEENFRAGTRGQSAYDTITGFDRAQGAAVGAARDDIADTLGNPANRIDAAEAVISGVRREADTARAAGSAAYDVLDQSGAALRGDAFSNIERQIVQSVRADGLAIDAGTPNAQAALNVLRSAFHGSERGAVPFTAIERARQQAVAFRRAAYSGSNGPDQAAADAVVNQFDGWLDDTITDALISGDDAVLGQAKEARALWARYRQTFLSRDGADNFIRKIVEDDLAPDQVAGWLYGASDKIGGGQSSLVARRVKDILGPESAEWSAVRRAAWDRITSSTPGRDNLGPQAIATNISEMLDGKGQTLGRELFTEYERRAMAEFRDMLKVLVPPRKATNPSGSSYDIQRSTQEMTRMLAGMIFGQGTGTGVVGAAAGRQAVEVGGNLSATLQARAAARGITFAPASVPVAIGAGVGAAAAVQEETIR